MTLPISQEKQEEWKNKIQQQKTSGKSVSDWCRENQIKPKVFYYWRSKFFPAILQRSSFTELTSSRNTGIVIECGGVRICLEKHFDLTTLKHCLTALR